MKLTVLSGLPGSGKSTMARALASYTGSMLAEYDRIRERSKFHDAGMITLQLQDLVSSYLDMGMDVVVDACNLHEDDRKSFEQMARNYNAQFTWVKLEASPEQCVERDAGRADPVGKERIMAMAAGRVY